MCGFPGGSVVKNLPANVGDTGSIPRRRKWQPTPVFLHVKSHGQRTLTGYSPRGCQRVRHELVTKQQQELAWCDHTTHSLKNYIGCMTLQLFRVCLNGITRGIESLNTLVSLLKKKKKCNLRRQAGEHSDYSTLKPKGKKKKKCFPIIPYITSKD